MILKTRSMKASPSSRALIFGGTFLVAFAIIGRAAEKSIPAENVRPPSKVTGPRIEFQAKTFDFEKVRGGEFVRHDFIFTNTGVALLEITAVSPSCGCTSAGEW